VCPDLFEFQDECPIAKRWIKKSDPIRYQTVNLVEHFDALNWLINKESLDEGETIDDISTVPEEDLRIIADELTKSGFTHVTIDW